MNCWNLHNHKVKVFLLSEKGSFTFKEELNTLSKKTIAKLDSNVCAFYCNDCNNLYKDYQSNFSLIDNNNINRNISLFGTSNIINKLKKNNQDISFYEFLQFNDSFLIGTKNEIISFIFKEYNNLKEAMKVLDSTNKKNEKSITKITDELKLEKSENQKKRKDLEKAQNLERDLKEKIEDLNKNLKSEKNKNLELNNKLDNISHENNENVKKVLEQVENEKKINKNLNSRISELQNKEKQLNLKNEESKEFIKQKDKEIQNLTNNNKSLGNNVEILKKKLDLKEKEIKNINNSLNKEKNINQNISQDLQSEKERNKMLTKKLDNISNENNQNVRKVLEQVENEKKINKDLESKISELKVQKKENNKKNEELEKELKTKEEEINNFKKNIPEKIGLKFQSDSKAGEYDIILDITSFKSLHNEGWKIKYNKDEGKQKYLKKKDEPTIVVGVIGNGNKGKSFFLEKLSDYEIPKGFNVKTEGLSIRYGTSQDHNVAILDSAGQETPLLKIVKENSLNEDEKRNIFSDNKLESDEISQKSINPEKEGNKNNDANKEKKQEDEIKNNENNAEPKNGESEEIEFEKYSRDKLLTEYFLQKFIIWKSDILILVVGNISLTEQKLLSRIKTEVGKLDKSKQIYVVHNLKDYSTEEQVNDYIENTLKKLYKIDLEENTYQNIRNNNKDDNNRFNKYFIEKGQKVSHFIFINEFSEKADYYNAPTIEFIQQEIEVIKTRTKFSIIDDCKQFVVKMAEEIMEENPKIDNLITIEEEKCDKIVLKNIKEINLKKFVIDEMGYTLNNDSSEPKYSYYINKEDKMFYVNIELPGGGSITPDIEIGGGNYFFIYEGVKKGDEIIENDSKCETKKLLRTKNLRKSNKFKLVIQIPCSDIQIKLNEGEELSEAGENSHDGKGVYTFKYKVIILGDKKDKKKQKRIDL